MNTLVGFVTINKNATTCKGALNPNEFIGETCSVMEFDREGGVLCLNPPGTALAMFDKEDVARSFKCGYSGGVITPPNLDMLAEMSYVIQAQQRKGGYCELVRNMVIEASLMKGEFTDSFLWAMQ
jgi:hypothetical protein